MKKYILGILMIIYSDVSQGQEENKYSIGMDADYYYNFLEGNNKNNFNYGFSLLMTEKIAKIKVGIGINLSTLNYNYTVNPTDYEAFYLKKREYEVQYLNFPLLVFFNNNNSSKLKNINPYVGIIVNTVIRYDKVSYYLNTPPYYQKNIDIPWKLGFTFRSGVNFSKTISKHIVLNAAPFIDFKFASNSIRNPKTEELPDRGKSIGFKLGIDYLL